MKKMHTLREIEDVTRNCHQTVGQIARFFGGFLFFFLMTKDRRGL